MRRFDPAFAANVSALAANVSAFAAEVKTFAAELLPNSRRSLPNCCRSLGVRVKLVHGDSSAAVRQQFGSISGANAGLLGARDPLTPQEPLS